MKTVINCMSCGFSYFATVHPNRKYYPCPSCGLRNTVHKAGTSIHYPVQSIASEKAAEPKSDACQKQADAKSTGMAGASAADIWAYGLE